MKSNFSFPLGVEPSWVSPTVMPPPNNTLHSWLLDTGSLTERLRHHCDDFEVLLLGQAELPISAEEQALLCTQDTSAVVREVVLCGDKSHWVFARTLMQVGLCEDGIDNLRSLGRRPLGQVIFNDPRFNRQPFELCQISPPSQLHTEVATEKPLWGRRSVFTYEQWRMSVAEIFLPSSPAYQQEF